MILQCWAGFPHLVSEQVGVVGELGANGTIQEAWQTRHVDHFTWQFRAPWPVEQGDPERRVAGSGQQAQGVTNTKWQAQKQGSLKNRLRG